MSNLNQRYLYVHAIRQPRVPGDTIYPHRSTNPIPTSLNLHQAFQNYSYGDSENCRRPKLAADFATMSDSDKEVEIELYRRRQAHYFYVGCTSSLNKAHFHTMGQYHLFLRNQLYDAVGRPWKGDNTSLQAELIRILAHWSEIASPDESPPVHYTAAEVEECLDRDAKQKDADEQCRRYATLSE